MPNKYYKYYDDYYDNYDYEIKNKVFLSYAYEDRLYTLSLFFYMLYHNIELYVDWMRCPKLDSGIQIKGNLSDELFKSNQFLFLRSPKSELGVGGNPSIRGWCSWEMGSFYNLKSNNKDDKFYLEIYQNEKNRINEIEKNLQLDGMKKLELIKNARLCSL